MLLFLPLVARVDAASGRSAQIQALIQAASLDVYVRTVHGVGKVPSSTSANARPDADDVSVTSIDARLALRSAPAWPRRAATANRAMPSMSCEPCR